MVKRFDSNITKHNRSADDEIETCWCCNCCKERKHLSYYVIYNIIKWLTISGLIFYLSYHHYKTITNPSKTRYCCDCEQYAMSNLTDNNYRLDWSYCLSSKDCSCNLCNNPQITYPITETCEVISNQLKNKTILPTKNRKGCDDKKLSQNNFFWLPMAKDIRIYGIVTIAVCLLYCIVTLIIYCIEKNSNFERFYTIIGIQLWIYNLLVALICSYCLFKIFQYYENKNLFLPINPTIKFTCYIDAISKKDEKILNWLSRFTFGLYAFISCFLCICKLIFNCHGIGCITKDHWICIWTEKMIVVLS